MKKIGYEIDQEERDDHKQCEVKHISRGEEGGLVRCDRLTEYRVRRYSEKKFLTAGGDPQNAKDYKSEQTEATQYLCRHHFERFYLYAGRQVFAGECPSEFMEGYEYGRYTGPFTFRAMLAK
jgi:hypothetical protein